ncbi:MAG: endonuclease, partial [Okeania sp. SIO4D6]|nr:endonuclease [Okeania sp. SIO4D6]
MVGYNPEFLGTDFPLPMPSFSPSLVGNVLRKPELRDDIYVDYINFTVIMNRVRRSPLVTALNIDQNLLKKVERKSRWDIDTRVGCEYQLDNDYYANNCWDRGHLARRASAAWGHSTQEARRASDATFFFTNAALQHENFNPDEWLALEDWVKDLTLDQNGLITEFTGPIYGDFGRTITPSGRKPAVVPSGFFKIVCFINGQTQELDVR